MIFNSLEFLCFLPIVFTLYWAFKAKNLLVQNALLMIASYVFYSWWDWRFLILIVLSTVVDFIIGQKIYETQDKVKRKRWLWLSLTFNLGLLIVFKYFGFFTQSFIDAFAALGYQMNPITINLILPVGISFYTFQTLSYSIDIYKDKLVPTKNFIAFAAFVSFFPQLVAGPIERASNLLPQILNTRKFNSDDAIDGLEKILWGFFKKLVIADSMGSIADQVFDDPASYSGQSMIIGTLAFSLQIYGDFSGYSDIAIGTAKLFGIKLMTNFNFPYISRNIGEFWRRWHISLSTWFRDYLYIPLGGSRGNKMMSIRNIFIVFLISGLWHGANWTFVVWGLIHALIFIPLFLFKFNRKHRADIVSKTNTIPSVKDLISALVTFTIVSFAWIFFRSNTIFDAATILKGIITNQSGHNIVMTNNEILSIIISSFCFLMFSIIYLYQKSQIILVSKA